MNEIVVEPSGVERRLHPRFKSKTSVFVRYKMQNLKRQAVNLSAVGVAIATNDLSMRVGSLVDLNFTINLGDTIKIHRRKAVVKFVKNGVTGLQFSFPEKK